MIFTKNYNAVIKLMCEVSPEFKAKYAELVNNIPQEIKVKCKKGVSFYDGTYEFDDQLAGMRFSIYDTPNNYITLDVVETMPHTVSWLDHGERTEIGSFEINNDEFNFYIEKINANKFKVIVTRDHKEIDSMRFMECTYDELAEKLDTSVRLTSIKQNKK